MRASAWQIAFLVFALQFFAMLAASTLAPRLGWPGAELELLGRLMTFGAASAILFGIPSIRRHCLQLLHTPGRAGSGEIALAIATKVAVPFALAGLAVLGAVLSTDESMAQARLRTVDPAEAWRWLLTPAGLVTTMLLSWLVGPFVEEIVFRGLLQPAFERAWGWALGSLLNGLVFALMHPTHFVAAAVGSVVMACVWRRTRSLRDCIVVHVGYNIAISWPLLGQWLFAQPQRPLLELSQWVPHFIALAVVVVALPAWVWAAIRRPAEAT